MIPKLNKLIREKENYSEFEQEVIDILEILDYNQDKLIEAYGKK